MRDITWYLSSAWLISLSVMLSRSISTVSKGETHTENRLTSVTEEEHWGGLGEKGWIKQKQTDKLIDTDNSAVITKGIRVWGEVEVGKGGKMVIEGDCLGW